MTKHSAIPALRFNEFDEPWNKVKLDKAFTIYNGFAFSSHDAVKKGAKWVKIADVGINMMKTSSASYLPASFVGKHSKFVLHEGDYVVALTRPILNGRLKIARISKFFDGALLNQRVGKIQTSQNLKFIYYFLQRDKIISKIENEIAGTDPPNLSPNNVSYITSFICPIPEQLKIAEFLGAVDEKIVQLQKKKDLLEDYKKGCMQKLFSQEIRFTDNNDNPFPDWKQKKLGALELYISDGNYGEMYPKANQMLPSGVPFVRANNFKEGRLTWNDMKFISPELHGVLTSGHLKANDILVTTRGDIGTIAYVENEFEGANINAQICLIRANKKIIPQYLFQYLSLESSNRQFKSHQTGSALKQLPKGNLNKIIIDYPHPDEQKKIADFLSALDDKISLIADELDKAKTFKKGLLQQMFV